MVGSEVIENEIQMAGDKWLMAVCATDDWRLVAPLLRNKLGHKFLQSCIAIPV